MTKLCEINSTLTDVELIAQGRRLLHGHTTFHAGQSCLISPGSFPAIYYPVVRLQARWILGQCEAHDYLHLHAAEVCK